MGNDRLIYFRADGNDRIATGHLVRCLSVADACQKHGMAAHFLVSDAVSASLLKETLLAPFPVTCLPGACCDNPERELPALLPLLAASGPEKPLFFLDSYLVTEPYLDADGRIAKTAYLDDLQLFDYPVDLLINYDVIPKQAMPSFRAFYGRAKKCLLGASYTPLGSRFANREMPVRATVSQVLVTTGASDPHHFCLSFIDRLEKMLFRRPDSFSGMTFHIVAGSLNYDAETLFAVARRLPCLRVHGHVSDMASLMEDCDLAVSASGTTLYELCALGVPAVSDTMADNQLASARAFAAVGAIPCAGDIRSSMEHSLDGIFDFLTQMSQKDRSFAKRKSAHEIMRGLIDGNGSARIAEALLPL